MDKFLTKKLKKVLTLLRYVGIIKYGDSETKMFTLWL